MITHRFSGEPGDPQIRVAQQRQRPQSQPVSPGSLPVSVQDIEKWVKQHQLVSLSVAVILGVGVGWMIKRKW